MTALDNYNYIPLNSKILRHKKTNILNKTENSNWIPERATFVYRCKTFHVYLVINYYFYAYVMLPHINILDYLAHYCVNEVVDWKILLPTHQGIYAIRKKGSNFYTSLEIWWKILCSRWNNGAGCCIEFMRFKTVSGQTDVTIND